MKAFITLSSDTAEATDNFAKTFSDKAKSEGLSFYCHLPGDTNEAEIKKALMESDIIILILGFGKPSASSLFIIGAALLQGVSVHTIAIGEFADTSDFASLSSISITNINAEDINNAALGHVLEKGQSKA